jgi:hypothetical protein
MGGRAPLYPHNSVEVSPEPLAEPAPARAAEFLRPDGSGVLRAAAPQLRAGLGPGGGSGLPRKRGGAEAMYKILALAAVGVGLEFLAALWHLGDNSMIACGFLGAFFIHAGSRPPRKQLLLAGVLGGAFAALYLLAGQKFGTEPAVLVLAAGAFLGLGSLAVFAFDQIWRDDRTRREALRDALVLPVFSFIAGVGMGLVNGKAQPTYDLFLYAFDAALGIQPNQLAVSLYRNLPWIGTAANWTYASLLIFPPLYHAWANFRGVRTRMHQLSAFVIAGVCGFLLYQLCPAEGPRYCFGPKFPGALPVRGQFAVQSYLSDGAHNAIPSMHMTWALLVWWSSWEIGPAALAIASGFAALTFLATLGSGEHYLVDLIVAFPFAMAIEGICTRNWARTGTGFALALGWFALLRSGEAAALQPSVSWGLVTGTLLIVAAMQGRSACRALMSRRGAPASRL